MNLVRGFVNFKVVNDFSCKSTLLKTVQNPIIIGTIVPEYKHQCVIILTELFHTFTK